MADKKITELPVITGANLNDVDEFVVVDISADLTKSITLAEFKNALDTGSGFVRITGDTMTGDLTVPNVVVSGNVDGRDVSADGTKLDGIEALADVTDTTNVTAAGALMDSEVVNLAQVKAFDETDYATAAQGVLADSSIQPNDSPSFGSVTVTGTVDGRDIAADGTKLDGIEASADVTDTANVTSAGALMDSEVTNLAQVKAFDSGDYATAAQGTLADSAVQPDDSPTFGAVTATSYAGDGSALTGLPSGYTNADVDTHLNTSTAANGEVMSWTGTDYDWIAAAASISITKTLLTTGTAATYTTPTDAFAIEVEVQGAGGGGGGVDGQGSGSAGIGVSGAAGGFTTKLIVSPAATYTYTIGAGGAGAASGLNDGSTGGSTSFTDGASLTMAATGGAGGLGMNASAGNSSRPAAVGGTSSGGDLNKAGDPSGAAAVNGGDLASFSYAGSSKYGSGGTGISGTDNGEDATGYGAGGSGASVGNSTANRAGGDGSGGIIVITEYRL